MHSEIAKFIDHTLLHPAATRQDISKLTSEASEHGFYAVCVNPCHVRQAVRELSATEVAVAAAIGFPLGGSLTDVKVAEAQRAVAEGAEELDMVINIGWLKDGEIDLLTDEIKAIVKVASTQSVKVKVIIETELLSEDEKIAAVQACVKAKAHMIKTCTGFLKDTHGATVDDITLIKNTLQAENSDLGIKASGGIRDYQQAKALLDAGATRLGTSSGLAIVRGTEALTAAH